MWCCWITSPQMAPPSRSTTGLRPGKGGAQSPLKTRWSIPKVSVIHFPLLQKIREQGKYLRLHTIHKWPKKEKKRDQARELFTIACVYQSFDWCLLISPAENTSSVQIHAEVHKSLDMFASCLAKAIESDAKLTLFGESSALSAGLLTVRAAPKPRYLEGQRLRLESIDEGIVKDDRGEEDQDGEEKPTWTQRHSHSWHCYRALWYRWWSLPSLHVDTPYLKLLANRKRHVIHSTMLDPVHSIKSNRKP